MFRKLIVLLLVFAMSLSIFPVAAMAEEIAAEDLEEIVEEIPETAEPETEPEAATIPAETEEPVPEEDIQPAAESAAATSGACGDNLSWSLEGGILTISGSGPMWDYYFRAGREEYESNLPGWVNETVVRVVFSGNITSIGDFAFYQNTELESITIPNTVTSMGTNVFQGCESLMDVTLSDSMDTIDMLAFDGCVGLTQITIPESVKYICLGAFSNCTSLESIFFTGDAPEISYGEHFEAGESFDGVEATAYYPADNATWTSSVKQNYGGTITWLPDTAYKPEHAHPLVRINIRQPDCTTPGYTGDWYCESCQKIVGSGKEIPVDPDAHAFSNGICSRCKQGESGICGDTMTWSFDSSGVLTISGSGNMYDYHETDPVPPWNHFRTAVTAVKITGNVQDIGNSAFSDCINLASVSFSAAVESIGDYAFRRCGSLTEADLPISVSKIGFGAFYDCSDLEKVTLPYAVTEIPNMAFAYCPSLTAVTLPARTARIRSFAFTACTGLKEIIIPSTVTAIDTCALSDCTALKKVVFTGDLPQISEDAFDGVTANAYYPSSNTTWTASARQNYGGKLTWVSSATPAAPNRIVNIVSGVHIYWKANDGITKYGLWRAEGDPNGTYKLLKTTSYLHAVDTNVSSGKEYYYKLTSVDASGKHSEKSNPLGMTYVATPDLTLRVNRAAGIGLGWNKISGATGYAIYRKSYSGTDSWTRIATITSGETTTWNDTSVKNKNGEVYKYTIRALTGDNRSILSGCRNAGRTMVRLTSRTLTSAAKTGSDSIKVGWTTTKAATGYEVRFMVGSNVYKTFTIGNYKTGAKTFYDLPTGRTYKVQVRSYKKVSGVGGFYSAWSIPKNVTLS